MASLGAFENVVPELRHLIDEGRMRSSFVVPPFSVLNAREGFWQERKRKWVLFGVKGEEGRTNHELGFSEAAENFGYKKKQRLAPGGGGGGCWLGGQDPEYPTKLRKKKGIQPQPFTGGMEGEAGVPGGQAARYKGKRRGQCYAIGDKKTYEASKLPSQSTCSEKYNTGTGTSVFDPVLCELMYRWFCPDRGSVLDPFAGESTKGIVASALGYQYTGIELRPEQVAANNKQAQITKTTPTWIQGDSARIGELLPKGARYDFVWTSPPYYDLEVYSNRDQDGSAFGTYREFMVWYADIFKQCVDRLKDNRFLAVKVGEIRNKKGAYRDFVGGNVRCFRRLGLHYYNEIILVTAVGSLPIRVGAQFRGNRKIGKTHQNILVFYKGDLKAIKREFGDSEVSKQKDQG